VVFLRDLDDFLRLSLSSFPLPARRPSCIFVLHAFLHVEDRIHLPVLFPLLLRF